MCECVLWGTRSCGSIRTKGVDCSSSNLFVNLNGVSVISWVSEWSLLFKFLVKVLYAHPYLPIACYLSHVSYSPWPYDPTYKASVVNSKAVVYKGRDCVILFLNTLHFWRVPISRGKWLLAASCLCSRLLSSARLKLDWFSWHLVVETYENLSRNSKFASKRTTIS
jgi:hypothetical protein